VSEREWVGTRFVARVRALLPEDWSSRAGERLRQTVDRIASFARKHGISVDEGVALGERKIRGLANKEYADSLKSFAEAEQKKIETELYLRTLESKVRKEQAEARLAEIDVLNAELELMKKLKEMGVVICRDEQGNLAVLPTPPRFDLMKLAGERHSRESPDNRDPARYSPDPPPG